MGAVGLAEPIRKGRLDTWGFLVRIFKGPFLSLHPSPLEQTLNLNGSERSTVRSKTHKPQGHKPQEGSSVLSSSLSVLRGPGGPTQAKTLPGANWHLEPWHRSLYGESDAEKRSLFSSPSGSSWEGKGSITAGLPI